MEIATLPADAIDLNTGMLTVYRMLAREKQVHPLTGETLMAAQRYLSFCSPSSLLLMGSRKGGLLTGHMTDRAILAIDQRSVPREVQFLKELSIERSSLLKKRSNMCYDLYDIESADWL